MMTRADWLVLAGAVALLPYLYISYWGTAVAGDQARILVSGEELMTVSLKENQEFAVPGARGSSTIQVLDGKIRFTASPCSNKQCIHSGWLAQGGEFAACLPNRISLVVTGANNRFDTINF